ncbi:unnamed protein product [Pleuronectes platessa]|uniref:Uncharacterized protein n=1 Tax=Pleuronectes platessa TaxID=8262 RepID=A0A9N7VTT4_PLEPL|nr:unnamed protein product [Pleuronectes platessa]
MPTGSGSANWLTGCGAEPHFSKLVLLTLLFSTIPVVNRLLSHCTRPLIQELVCTDDGLPFTALIKVAAARSERENGWKRAEEGECRPSAGFMSSAGASSESAHLPLLSLRLIHDFVTTLLNSSRIVFLRN